MDGSHFCVALTNAAHSRAKSIATLLILLLIAPGSFAMAAHRPQRCISLHQRRLDAHNRRLALLERKRHEARLARMSPRQREIVIQNAALCSGSVVQAATAFEGTRYVFGGTSRSGFDCSGFTRFILGKTAGVAIPRTAVEQYYNGAPIPRAKLRAGDLVFFRNTYRPGISHVGIYVGKNRFVHAANSNRGVVIENLADPYYTAHYAGARRVAGPDRELRED